MAIDNKNQNDITEKIREVIDSIEPSRCSTKQFYDKVIDENIKNSVKIIQEHIKNTEIKGAKYLLDSGKVEWI